MRKILNYAVPPIKCYLHHAFPLGVFWNENDLNIMNWFCLNYNYVIAGTGPLDYVYTFLINQSSVPFIQRREIYGDELEKYLVKHSFSTLVNEAIDNGNLVEVMADMFYMPQSRVYKEQHLMHEILILGYDDEKETYIIRDYVNHVFEEFEVLQSQVVPFENCSYYGDDIVMKLYRKRNNYFPFDIRSFLIQINDYYESINPFYRFSCVHGTYFEPWEKIFGMEVFNKIIGDFKKVELIDYRPIRLIQEHFDSMKVKLRYIQKENYLNSTCLVSLISYYENAAVKAEMIVRLAVKQTMVSYDKRKEIKQRILIQLEELVNSERNILKSFLENVYSDDFIES